MIDIHGLDWGLPWSRRLSHPSVFLSHHPGVCVTSVFRVTSWSRMAPEAPDHWSVFQVARRRKGEKGKRGAPLGAAFLEVPHSTCLYFIGWNSVTVITSSERGCKWSLSWAHLVLNKIWGVLGKKGDCILGGNEQSLPQAPHQKPPWELHWHCYFLSLCFSKILESNWHAFQVWPKYRVQFLYYLLWVELSYPKKALLESQPPVPLNGTLFGEGFWKI